MLFPAPALCCRQNSEHWAGSGMGDDSDLPSSKSPTTVQELQKRDHRGSVAVHVCAAGAGQHHIRAQHLHQVMLAHAFPAVSVLA